MSSSISVITTFPPNKWEQYAKKMLETFVEQWPSTINLKVYFEGTIPSDAPQDRKSVV